MLTYTLSYKGEATSVQAGDILRFNWDDGGSWLAVFRDGEPVLLGQNERIKVSIDRRPFEFEDWARAIGKLMGLEAYGFRTERNVVACMLKEPTPLQICREAGCYGQVPMDAPYPDHLFRCLSCGRAHDKNGKPVFDEGSPVYLDP